MRVSVALATYNGAAFLDEQLQSLASQSVPPDEIILCDDGSLDGTLDVAARFAETHPGISVELHRNGRRLGYAANFATAIARCTGDVIFLCDQDDVWFPDKIATVLDLFAGSQHTLLVVNDAQLVESDLSPTGCTLHQRLRDVGLGSRDNLYGCCMALRRSFLAVILPVPAEIMGHDGWINSIANAAGADRRVESCLQAYRRHGANASSGAETDLGGSGRWKRLLAQSRVRQRMLPSAASRIRIKVLQAVEARLVREQGRLGGLTENPERVLSGLTETQVALRRNIARLEMQQLDPLPRLLAATRFLLSGGYREFEGLKSWVRDVSA